MILQGLKVMITIFINPKSFSKMNKLFSFFICLFFVSCTTDPIITPQSTLDKVHFRTSSFNENFPAFIKAYFPDGHSETLSGTHVAMTFVSSETMTVVVDQTTTLVCTKVEVNDTASGLCVVAPNVCAQNQVKVSAGSNQLHYTINPSELVGQSASFVVEETDGL